MSTENTENLSPYQIEQRQREARLKAERQALAPKIIEVVKLLGLRPEVHPEYHFVFGHDDAVPGFRLDINLAPYKDAGRLSISGHFPENTYGLYFEGQRVEPVPSIGIANTKSAEVIARDIGKRFLPQYRDTFTLYRKALESRNNYEGTKKANYERIQALVKSVSGRGSTDYSERNQEVSLYGFGPVNYGDVRMSGSDSVELKINTTVEGVLALLEAIKHLRPKNN